MRKYPGVQNLQTDLRLNTPEVRVAINRDKLSDVGVPVETLGRTLETMLGGRQVTRFKRNGEQHGYSPAVVHALHEAVNAFYAVLGRYTLADLVQNRATLAKVLLPHSGVY